MGRRSLSSVGLWGRCALLCLFEVIIAGLYDNSYFPKDMFDKEKYFVSNPVFIYIEKRDKVVLQCVPDGEQTPEKAQAYFWRYLNSKPVLRGSRYSPNYLTGKLEINKPDVTTDETFKCDVVTSDELVIPFYHSVVTVLEAVVKRIYTIYGYMVCECQDVYIKEEGFQILAITNKNLCGTETGANCPYEVTLLQADKTEKLNISNQWTNYELKTMDACMLGYAVRYSLPPDFKKTLSCPDYNCTKQKMEEAVIGDKEKEFDDLIAAFKQRFPTKKYVSKGNQDACSVFEPLNWTSRTISQCPPGYRSDSTIFCVPCQPGTKSRSVGVDQENVCDKCPEDTFNYKFHQTNCSRCIKPLTVNREATRCTRVKRLMGEHDVDMKALLRNSQQVVSQLGVDPTVKLKQYWLKIKSKRYRNWVIAILGSSLAFVLLIGIFVWKCNKSIDDKNFEKYGREKTSTKHMMFKAATEVYKKKQIVDSLTPEEQENFNQKTAKEQNDYLEEIIERDKLKRRLHTIRYRPIGPPLDDEQVGRELPLGNTVGGVKVTKDADKKWDKNNSGIPFPPTKNRLTPLPGIRSAEESGKMVGVASIISSESPSPRGIIAGTLLGKRPGSLLPPGNSSMTPYSLPANVSRQQKTSLTWHKGELGDKGKVTTKPVPKVVIKDFPRALPMTIPKIPKSQSMMKMEKVTA